jgi:hypothetical protein
MRIVHTAGMLAATVTLLAACGEDTGPRAANSDVTAPATTRSSGGGVDTPSTVWSGEVIPDGTYGKTATIAEAREIGLRNGPARELLGPDGELPLKIKIAGDRWAHFLDEAGAMVVGDEGTATYDADGNWVVTSESSGCPGCIGTFEWTIEDGRLTLELLETTEVADPVDMLIGRLVTEGRWTRE